MKNAKKRSQPDFTWKQTSAEDFVKAWAKGGTIADVAKRAGMSLQAATARGIRFRKLGVRLPALERRTAASRIDVKVLNALLAHASLDVARRPRVKAKAAPVAPPPRAPRKAPKAVAALAKQSAQLELGAGA